MLSALTHAITTWRSAAAIALHAPMMVQARTRRANLRTGGPDPDGDDGDDEQLRRLMPILALVIVVAVIFGQ